MQMDQDISPDWSKLLDPDNLPKLENFFDTDTVSYADKLINPDKSLNWENFTVFALRGVFPKEIGWKPSHELFRALTCSRHTYVGPKSGFENLPDYLFEDPEILRSLGKEDIAQGSKDIYHGKDAYCFLVQLIAGLRSRHYPIDDYVSGQVKLAWQKYARNNLFNQRPLKPFMDMAFHDARLIKKSFLSAHSSHPTPLNTAVKMAGLSPNNGVIIFGGDIDLTVRAICALGHKKPHTPDVITLTHPDEMRLNKICKKVKNLDEKSAIQAELIRIPFDDALKDLPDTTTLFNAMAVFVCQPMQANKINQQIVDAWLLRSKHFGLNHAILIDLETASPVRKPTEAWKALTGTKRFISYPDIVKENDARTKFVERVIAEANEAVLHISELRMQGDRVKSISFIDEKTPVYELANRPLGKIAAQGNFYRP